MGDAVRPGLVQMDHFRCHAKTDTPVAIFDTDIRSKWTKVSFTLCHAPALQCG